MLWLDCKKNEQFSILPCTVHILLWPCFIVKVALNSQQNNYLGKKKNNDHNAIKSMTCHHITVGDFSILASYHSRRCFYFDFHFEEALTNYYSAHSGHVLLEWGSLKNWMAYWACTTFNFCQFKLTL